MIDPLGGILAFLYLLADDHSKKRKANEYLKKRETEKASIPSYPHPEPHRDPKTGKIVIENSQQYYEDVKNHGAYQAQQWVKQGKYNLTPEELKKEEERLKKKYEYLYKL